MPRKRKIEASTFERPEAEDPAAAATTAPEGAPKRKRGRKAKETVPATCAAPGCEQTFLGVVTDGGVVNAATDSPLCASCGEAQDAGPAPEAPEAPTTPAPRKRATTKRKAKPAADTGADSANTGPKGDATMNQLAELYQRHLQDAGKSLGTQFSYAQDFQVAVRFLGEKTKLRSLTPAKVGAFFESAEVTRTKTGRPKAEVTIAKCRRVCRFALEFAVQTGLLSTSPLPSKAD